MSRVLLIGAKGMLGQELAQVFAGGGLEAWDREELDITDGEAVRKETGRVRPEWIINAAAYTDVDGAEADRAAAFLVNETGVRNLAEAARENGAALIHYSTDYVFPGKKPAGYGEDDQPGPAVNTYGESKLAGERALKEAGGRTYIIRTAWLYGAGGKNFVETMLKLGGDRQELSVVDDQHGSPTYAKDLALYTKEVVTGGYPAGIYHAVNSGVTTWCGFARKIFELEGMEAKVKPVPSKEFPRPAKRPEWSVLVNNKGPAMRQWEGALEAYLRSRRGQG